MCMVEMQVQKWWQKSRENGDNGGNEVMVMAEEQCRYNVGGRGDGNGV